MKNYFLYLHQILKQIENKEFSLNSSLRWQKARQRLLLTTILHNYPIGSLTLKPLQNQSLVLDGNERLWALKTLILDGQGGLDLATQQIVDYKPHASIIRLHDLFDSIKVVKFERTLSHLGLIKNLNQAAEDLRLYQIAVYETNDTSNFISTYLLSHK